MADLNYIKSGGEYYYPVDKTARENLEKTNKAVKLVEEAVKLIKETGIATSWNQLLDRPFYEEENVTTVELYSGAISWSSKQAVIAVSVDTSKEHIIKLGTEHTFTPVAEWVTLGDYSVYYNGTNFTIKYTGTGTPANSVTITEVTKEVIVHKLDRKYIDMSVELSKFNFKSPVNSNNTPETVNGIYNAVNEKDYLYIMTNNGYVGKFELAYKYVDDNGNTVKEFHFEQMGATAEKSAKHIYTLKICSNDTVAINYYKTWFQNGNVTTSSTVSMRGLLIPNHNIKGL